MRPPWFLHPWVLTIYPPNSIKVPQWWAFSTAWGQAEKDALWEIWLVLSYTRTGIHVDQNFDWVRYSKIAGLSTSLMWHRGLNLVQSCKMGCAVCTLPHAHKSEPHRPIKFMLAAYRPPPVLRRFSWTQAFLGRSQPGRCGPNAGMKDGRAAGIGVVGSPLIDNSTKERRGFLERRRLGEGFRYRVLCRNCFGLSALV